MENNIFSKKWRTATCMSGESCWCRLVVTEDYNGEDENVFIGEAALNEEAANYIIKLHNERV